eukprot:TRINITY_DN15633_c0_g1_i1.p1 TRINITY_DN15633_c0_g1~~TRINITY_DN15633_c0_g1_i1.p1  ORF type:complete len:139 (-),score=2.17 TRINITY_DN15633_c0_g1_i1:34-450(-)
MKTSDPEPFIPCLVSEEPHDVILLNENLIIFSQQNCSVLLNHNLKDNQTALVFTQHTHTPIGFWADSNGHIVSVSSTEILRWMVFDGEVIKSFTPKARKDQITRAVFNKKHNCMLFVTQSNELRVCLLYTSPSPRDQA